MGKAQRIASHLWTWLPRLALPKRTQFALTANPRFIRVRVFFIPSFPPAASNSGLPYGLTYKTFDRSSGLRLHSRRRPPLACFMRKTGTRCLTSQLAWIAARAGPVLEATACRCEAMRLLLWLQ